MTMISQQPSATLFAATGPADAASDLKQGALYMPDDPMVVRRNVFNAVVGVVEARMNGEAGATADELQRRAVTENLGTDYANTPLADINMSFDERKEAYVFVPDHLRNMASPTGGYSEAWQAAAQALLNEW